MKRLSPLGPVILLVSVFSIIAATSMGASAQVPLSRELLVQGNTAFALELFRELAPKEGNLFFSPYSVSTALGMTYAGARENTAKEMADVLHFQLDQAKLHSAFKDLNGELAASARKSGQKLNIANALVLTGGGVGGGFKDLLKANYDAEIFRGGLDTINTWVKGKTEGKIDKILEALDTNSVCVLLNAIYFKGIWHSQFMKNSTTDAPFSVSATRKTSVPLMYQKSDFKIMEENDFQAVSIPYKGNNLSMVILLPKPSADLAALEKQLTPQILNGWLEKLDRERVQKVSLYLPKFKLETGYDLKNPFQKMGMIDAFQENIADFRGMGFLKKGDVWIGQIKHKAFVEVNEEGTEAAAATAVEMVTKSVQYDPIFRADHPFLFIIRDNASGSILFLGRMVDPDKK
ncbi:MAG: serpin family protein [Desulfobacteraceae bacterium]|jgi:serpin B